MPSPPPAAACLAPSGIPATRATPQSACWGLLGSVRLREVGVGHGGQAPCPGAPEAVPVSLVGRVLRQHALRLGPQLLAQEAALLRQLRQRHSPLGQHAPSGPRLCQGTLTGLTVEARLGELLAGPAATHGLPAWDSAATRTLAAASLSGLECLLVLVVEAWWHVGHVHEETHGHGEPRVGGPLGGPNEGQGVVAAPREALGEVLLDRGPCGSEAGAPRGHGAPPGQTGGVHAVEL
uniref:Uncharacterized protein n=1 Tax=Ixodes ricinus TaxID=34613 RepID=A0A6B0V3T0_IXORI